MKREDEFREYANNVIKSGLMPENVIAGALLSIGNVLAAIADELHLLNMKGGEEDGC